MPGAAGIRQVPFAAASGAAKGSCALPPQALFRCDCAAAHDTARPGVTGFPAAPSGKDCRSFPPFIAGS